MLFQPSLNKNLNQVARRAIEFSHTETRKDTRHKRRTAKPVEENPTDEAVDGLVMQATLVVIGSCFAAAIIIVTIAILLTPHS